MPEKLTSEFGSGFMYPLALFIAHTSELRRVISDYKKLAESRPGLFGKNAGASLVLYAAADHLYEFDPEKAPKILKDRCIKFRDDCLSNRMNNGITPDRVFNMFEEAKTIFFELDKLAGASPIEADYA